MKRKEIQDLLEKLNSELKSEIENSQASLKEAKSISTKLNNLFSKANAWLLKLEDPKTGVSATLNLNTKNSQTISEVVSKSQSELEKIQQNLVTVQQNITTMQTAYTDFQAIKAKIDDPDTGLDAILAAAKQHKAKVQASATQAANFVAKIQQNLVTVQQNITTMQTAYTDFQAIKAKIDDPDTGLQATLDNSQTLKAELAGISKESQTLYKEVSRFKDSAAKNVASIEAIRESSEKTLENIHENKSESEKLKEKIAAIFELVSQSGHANYFDKRRRKLVLASWLWIAFSTVCILLAIRLGLDHVAPIVKTDNSSEIAIEALIVRASLITPLVALAIFGITNYNRERKLAEQYAFKAVSASTVEGSITLLDRSLDKIPDTLKHEKVASFAVDTIKAIHAEPLELTRTARFKLNASNKLVKVGGELSDRVEALNKNIQELTDDKKK